MFSKSIIAKLYSFVNLFPFNTENLLSILSVYTGRHGGLEQIGTSRCNFESKP